MPSAGQQFRLTAAKVGEGPGSVLQGQVVSVREVVAAGVTGAGDGTTEAVVIEWTEAGPVIGDDGQQTIGQVPRAMSFPTSDFTTLFEEVQ